MYVLLSAGVRHPEAVDFAVVQASAVQYALNTTVEVCSTIFCSDAAHARLAGMPSLLLSLTAAAVTKI